MCLRLHTVPSLHGNQPVRAACLHFPFPPAHDFPSTANAGSGHEADRPSQTAAAEHSVGCRQVRPAAATRHADVQQRWTRGLHAADAASRHGAAVTRGSTVYGVQQRSWPLHDDGVPQSHCSPRSATALPQNAPAPLDERASRHEL